ncbi:hypothetical protein [Amycolatopsis speibonae]|uniref:Uncharacterized protein n=1 Tax=Amycolatopsis speibonae TaxID=1450224 RepID=A0ABV7P355_9PSEU
MSVEVGNDPAGKRASDYFGVSDVAVIAAGAVSGAVGAYAYYYSDLLRPLAHSFTIWIVLIVAVVPGMPRPARHRGDRGGRGPAGRRLRPAV